MVFSPSFLTGMKSPETWKNRSSSWITSISWLTLEDHEPEAPTSFCKCFWWRLYQLLGDHPAILVNLSGSHIMKSNSQGGHFALKGLTRNADSEFWGTTVSVVSVNNYLYISINLLAFVSLLNFSLKNTSVLSTSRVKIVNAQVRPLI